jgi:SAM-dependent methyltransferase
MSFWPIPKIILDELQAGLLRGVGIEIGAGEGRLTRRFADCGIRLHAVDLRSTAEIRADACALPFVGGSLGLVVAGNLLRHLEEPARAGFLDQAGAVLASGGRLLLIEDEPEARDPAESNYRHALELLKYADPARGGVLDLDGVLATRPDSLARLVVDVSVDNEESIDDASAPLRWLSSRGFADQPGFRELSDAVARDGMSYGRYRACVLRRTVETDGLTR